MKGVYALVLVACIGFLSWLVYVAMRSTRAECMPAARGIHSVFNEESPLLKNFQITHTVLRIGKREYPLGEVEEIRTVDVATSDDYGIAEVRVQGKRIRLRFMEKDSFWIDRAFQYANEHGKKIEKK